MALVSFNGEYDFLMQINCYKKILTTIRQYSIISWIQKGTNGILLIVPFWIHGIIFNVLRSLIDIENTF